LDESADQQSDLVGKSHGLNVVVARSEQDQLAGYIVDFQSGGSEAGFVFQPPAKPGLDGLD
jgi:Fe-S cluster assembly iron-binding protein IscA